MKKSILKYILTIVLCIGIGFGVGELISFMKLDSINVFSPFNIICVIAAFVTALIVSVTLHEIAHALYFRMHGIHIRLFAVFFLILNYCSGKWKLMFYPNKITSLGGLVIPNLPPINNKETFERVRKIYYNDLLIAPVVSGILALISIILLFLINSDSYNSGIAFIPAFVLMFIFTNLTIFFSSFIKTENIFGDFPAYHVYKNNDRTAKLQICQYLFFNDSWEEVVSESPWIIEETKTMAQNQVTSKIEMVDLQLLDWVIQMDFINKVTLDESMLNFMLKIVDSKDNLLSIPASESRDVLFYHTIYSLLRHNYIDTLEAKTKIDNLSANLLKNHPSKKYYTQLSNHILGGNDNTAWLKHHTNPNASYSLLKIFPSIVQIENQLIGKTII